MRGLGNIELRESLWEKQYWKGSEGGKEQKLVFDEVEKLCRGLNINSSREDLERLFSVCKISASLVLSLTVLQQADIHKRQYLDFDDFRRFVKLLKGRPEINRLYQRLKSGSQGGFDFGVFEKFMIERQMVRRLSFFDQILY